MQPIENNKANRSVIDDYGTDIAGAYYRNYHNGIYIRGNTDLASHKAQTLYSDYINSIITANPIEYQKKHFSKMEVDDIIDAVLLVLEIILGPSLCKSDECLNFFRSIEQTNTDSILDGICLVTVDKHGIKHYQTKISKLDSISSIVALTHEFMHYYIHSHDIAYVDKKFYYEEIMSLLAEKIACQIIKDQRVGDITKKIENTRLEVVSWHYNEGLNEYEQAINIHDLLKRIASFNSSAKKDLERMESDIPWLKSDVQIRRYMEYAKALRESYGIGYLYAENLFQKILDDSKNLDYIRNILKGNPISQVLNYYDINPEVEETYQVAKQKIKRMCS